MNSHEYDAFTTELTRRAEADPVVIGLIALGSMANRARRDEWSDHDFFWIVESGRQEHYRQQIDWLPNRDQVVLWFRETAHGLKVMYRNGHLLEFAVFDPDELTVAKINDYIVLFDRGDIAERTRQLADASIPAAIDPQWELSSLLSILLVGSGRHVRGEALSGHLFIKSYAIRHLLRLIAAVVPSDNQAELDSLDIFRRFEHVYPQLSSQIAAALRNEAPRCAWLLLDLIEQAIKPRMQSFPDAALATLRMHLSTSAAPLERSATATE